jgi:hypothetical protein
MRTNSSHTEEDCVFFQMVGEFKKKRGEKGKEIWKGDEVSIHVPG